CQIVVAVFQRHDPAIEQVTGADQLSAEIVNEEDAAVGFQMQRRLIEVGIDAVAQIEHAEIQFTTGDDDRPADTHPARIDSISIHQPTNGGFVIVKALIASVFYNLMNGRIKHSHDIAFALEGIGDVNFAATAIHEIADAVGDGSFAVAGRAVN